MIRGAIAFALVLTLPVQTDCDSNNVCTGCSEKGLNPDECFTV